MGAMKHWGDYWSVLAACGVFTNWRHPEAGRVTCPRCRKHRLAWRRVERQIDLELREQHPPEAKPIGDAFDGEGIGLRSPPGLEQIAESARKRSRAYHADRRRLRWAR